MVAQVIAEVMENTKDFTEKGIIKSVIHQGPLSEVLSSDDIAVTPLRTLFNTTTKVTV